MFCSARVSGSAAVSIVRFSAPTVRRLSGGQDAKTSKNFYAILDGLESSAEGRSGNRRRSNYAQGDSMGPYVDSVNSDEAIPATTSVVVIGGGIIGTFAALTLAGRGIPVVLCEK